MSQFHKIRRNCNTNMKQLSTSEFVSKFQNTIKNGKIVIFYFTGLVYANVIIHLGVDEKPSIFISTSVNNCSLITVHY